MAERQSSKTYCDMLRLKVLAATVLFFLGWSNRVRAQDKPPISIVPPAASGLTFTGTVVADGTGMPLPYSAVTIDPVGRERFTDQSGGFTFYGIPAGAYRVRVRQLGYIPLDTTIQIGPRASVSQVLVMTRIATALAGVQVSAPPRLCIVPDEYGFVGDIELATVLAEVRKNADRERLLRKTYPFEYRMAQSHSTVDLVTRKATIRYDTMQFRSDDNWRYRKGRVVSDDRNRLFGEIRVMRLPTLADLADRAFLTAHCFKYSGISDFGGLPTYRIDFAPDSALIAPDVEGSIFIDSASYLIKRAEFRLTRGGTVKPPILGMSVITTSREILPNVALFDMIVSAQPLGAEVPGANPTEFRERQQLLSFRFLLGGPPGTAGHKWILASELVAGGSSPSSAARAPAVLPPPP
ncbi:MAG: carboxypeptidase regulatory-like domain-containing protein [Gemmatimonadaceae bacterium]